MAGYEMRGLPELSGQARGYFTQAVKGAQANLYPNAFRVESKVMALLDFEHEQRRAYLHDQIFASRAARPWLIRHGYELGLGGPAAASAAAGTVLVAARAGLAVPAGLRLQAGSGATYTTLTAEVSPGSLVALPVVADVAGSGGNLGPGFPLALIASADVPEGLGPSAHVDDAGLAGGADGEELETYRARVLDRKRRPPQGGSAHDYAVWAAEALGPGVLRRAYVEAFQNNARHVWLCFTVTDQPSGIPTPGQVALVQAYCDDPIRRPVTARITAVAPEPLPVDVTIGNLVPDNGDVRAAVEDEIYATFADRAEVGMAVPALFPRAWLSEAVSRAVGEDRHELVAPALSVVATAGRLPVPGTITFA